MSVTFWHFTCDHGRAGIGRYGVIRPNAHPLLGVTLSWFTDNRSASRDDLGLTSAVFLDCDRMRYRYRAMDGRTIFPWLGSGWRALAPADVVAELESLSKPERWFVSAQPVHARLSGLVEGR